MQNKKKFWKKESRWRISFKWVVVHSHFFCYQASSSLCYYNKLIFIFISNLFKYTKQKKKKNRNNHSLVSVDENHEFHFLSAKVSMENSRSISYPYGVFPPEGRRGFIRDLVKSTNFFRSIPEICIDIISRYMIRISIGQLQRELNEKVLMQTVISVSF